MIDGKKIQDWWFAASQLKKFKDEEMRLRKELAEDIKRFGEKESDKVYDYFLEDAELKLKTTENFSVDEDIELVYDDLSEPEKDCFEWVLKFFPCAL